MNNKIIKGFSKLNQEEKISLLPITDNSKKLLKASLNQNHQVKTTVDQLSENTISHFTFPLGIAPNIFVNGKHYFVPLVTEESSVVAAIAKAAKFWAEHGGFNTEILGTEKKGQVHFFWEGNQWLLKSKEADLIQFIKLRIKTITRKMEKRGGGITSMTIIDCTDKIPFYFQLDVSFETLDAMGANFINTCLEDMAKSMNQFFSCDQELDAELLEVNMAILSNYTPNCSTKASVSCPVQEINDYGQSIGIPKLAQKIEKAVLIAKQDTKRAVTHNKGILNGIDALALATGNDWRAIESGAHAYAAKDGQYRSLSSVNINEGLFTFEIEIPIAIGTIGGVTNLHPSAKTALEILGNPNAKELMQLMACVGLASNFSAVLSLTSSGIQKGHMKMHLTNILLGLQANEEELKMTMEHFTNKTISHSEVEYFIRQLRKV
jgi:hydroxymethylglutaryl-CoA reductase